MQSHSLVLMYLSLGFLIHDQAFAGTEAKAAAAAEISADVLGFGSSGMGQLSATVPDDQRHHPHSTRPDIPQPQRPELSTDKNVDTGKSLDHWQHLTNDWGGLRPRLDDQGVIFESSVTTDWSSNLHGGANTAGSAFRNLLNVNLTLDLERLLGWEGATVFLNFQNQNGEDGSVDVGDFQAYSNVDADGRTEVAELWYEQVLLDGKLRVKIGKVEANSEFAFVDNAGEFLNSSMGFSPTVFVLPSYPDPSTSVNVFVYPNDNIYVGVGVYDGAGQEGVPTGTLGPKTFLARPADLFVIGEAGITWESGPSSLPGRLAVGGWGHTGTFTRFDATTDKGTEGYYLLLDQALWLENPAVEDDEQGIGAFFQYGWADPLVSQAEHHVGFGFAWLGALPGRDEDVCGVGVTWVYFTDEPGAGLLNDSETAVEVFYKTQITQWVSVKPDLQYINNPGGTGLNDALVGTLRVEVDF